MENLKTIVDWIIEQTMKDSNFMKKLYPENSLVRKGEKVFWDFLQTDKELLISLLEKNKSLLFHGMAGTGKTTIACALAWEMNRYALNLEASVERGIRDTIDNRRKLHQNIVVVIDEIHALPRKEEESIYPLFGVVPIIGTTTHKSKISTPLLSRFDLEIFFRRLSSDETEKFIGRLNSNLKGEVKDLIVKASKGIPRKISQILSLLKENGEISIENLKKVLSILSIDPVTGFKYEEIRILKLLSERGAMSLQSLASAIGMPTSSVISDVEPYLLEEGLIELTTRGRKITDKGKILVESFK